MNNFEFQCTLKYLKNFVSEPFIETTGDNIVPLNKEYKFLDLTININKSDLTIKEKNSITKINSIEEFVRYIIMYTNPNKDNEETINQILDSLYKELLYIVDAQKPLERALDLGCLIKYYGIVIRNECFDSCVVRNKVNELNNIINPFFDENISIEDNKFAVSCEFVSNYFTFTLYDKETNISLYTDKGDKGFNFQMHLPKTDSRCEQTLSHTFDGNKEMLTLEYIKENGIEKEEYQLEDNKIVEERKRIENILNSYLEIGKDVVTRNIISQNKTI